MIELIGALDRQLHYEACRIKDILRGDAQILRQDSAFMGRPQTKIYADADIVVKIRADLALPLDAARAWVQEQLAKERRLQVHHAYKTWFIQSNGGSCRIGSIVPRLTPLHRICQHKPESDTARQHYRHLLNALFQMYFTLVKEHATKLDEGLSNFGLDEQDQIYYLDDEFYAWDNGVALAVMTGVFLRSIPWLDTDFVGQMGRDLRMQMLPDFPDIIPEFASHLDGVFMPDAGKEGLRIALVAALLERTARSQHRPAPTQQRYWAILADIHANATALDRALDFYQEQGIQQGLVLGDMVGYGPDPKNCIERLAECGFMIIKGNHDQAVATGCTETGFSDSARFVIDWTCQQLSGSYRQWLGDLPACVHLDELGMAVHGAPIDPDFFNAYIYI